MVRACWEDDWKATNKRDLYGRCEWQRREYPRKTYPDLIGEILQKDQLRSTPDDQMYEHGRGEKSM